MYQPFFAILYFPLSSFLTTFSDSSCLHCLPAHRHAHPFSFSVGKIRKKFLFTLSSSLAPLFITSLLLFLLLYVQVGVKSKSYLQIKCEAEHQLDKLYGAFTLLAVTGRTQTNVPKLYDQTAIRVTASLCSGQKIIDLGSYWKRGSAALGTSLLTVANLALMNGYKNGEQAVNRTQTQTPIVRQLEC